jgi:ketosteroid isomerase-like protein
MMQKMGAALLAVLLAACSTAPPAPAGSGARQEVAAAEEAFARTMADRDHEAFATFIAEEAIFFGGPEPLRGKQQIVEGWKGFFEGPDAPFSWEPLVVEVLESGTLALSSGPVRNPGGETVAQFTSVWRLESDGNWRVIFDKGCNVCSGR